MTRRTPVFTDQHLGELRKQLGLALGEEDYWIEIVPLRLYGLMATLCNPEFARSAFGDESAALRAWGHNLPKSIQPEAVSTIAKRFLQSVEAEQAKVEIPSTEGFDTLLHELDGQLTGRLAQRAGGDPLVIVVRGLSGSGKSSLAEIIQRVGFRPEREVGLLTADHYLSRLGKDTASKKTVYRTEGGDIRIADPIHGADPISEVKDLVWENEFRYEFEASAERYKVIVVDGGYGDLLLDQIGISSENRLIVEVCLDAGLRFRQVYQRAQRSLPADRVSMRAMNDVIISMAWYSLLMQNAALPDHVVYPGPDDARDAVVARRSTDLGRPAKQIDPRHPLLRQFNVARDPQNERVTAQQLDLLTASVRDNLSKEAIMSGAIPELHRSLPLEIGSRMTVPQLQLIVAYVRAAESVQSR